MPPPHQDYQAPEYPPSDAVQWKTVTGIFEDKKSCPHCHSRDDFHWTVGCPVLAAINRVYVEDETKAKEISLKYQEHKGPRRDSGGRGGRGGRGGGGGGGGHGGADASSRRATSTECFPTPPPPSPPPTPPPQVAPPAHPQSTSQYPDTELSSDSNDNAEFIQNYGNLINSAIPK